jgi:hypothetical protein
MPNVIEVPMRRCSLCLAVVAVLTGALSASAKSDVQRRPVVVKSAKFGRLPHGWTAFQDDFGFLTRRGASVGSNALSWPYVPNSFGWATQMPNGGIAVNVLLLRRSPGRTRINLCRYAPHLRDSPKIRRLPLQLPKVTADRLERTPNVREYRIFARMDESYNVDLRIDINSANPTRMMLRTAQSVVNQIRFPT